MIDELFHHRFVAAFRRVCESRGVPEPRVGAMLRRLDRGHDRYGDASFQASEDALMRADVGAMLRDTEELLELFKVVRAVKIWCELERSRESFQGKYQ